VGAPLPSGDNAYSCLLLMTIPEFRRLMRPQT